MYIHTYTHTHAHIYTHIHTYTRTHTHTHTRTHTRSHSCSLIVSPSLVLSLLFFSPRTHAYTHTHAHRKTCSPESPSISCALSITFYEFSSHIQIQLPTAFGSWPLVRYIFCTLYYFFVFVPCHTNAAINCVGQLANYRGQFATDHIYVYYTHEHSVAVLYLF